jgi:hypothetical protein
MIGAITRESAPSGAQVPSLAHVVPRSTKSTPPSLRAFPTPPGIGPQTGAWHREGLQ